MENNNKLKYCIHLGLLAGNSWWIASYLTEMLKYHNYTHSVDFVWSLFIEVVLIIGCIMNNPYGEEDE